MDRRDFLVGLASALGISLTGATGNKPIRADGSGADTFHFSADVGPASVTLNSEETDDGGKRWTLSASLEGSLKVRESPK